jgi:hypothetical protein
VLLGGLAIAVNRWNEQHGTSSDTIYLMMPVNLRPAAWRQDIVGNFASYVSVRIDSGHQTTLDAAIQAAAASTQRIKDGGIAGLIIDLFGAPTLLPTGIKCRLQDLLPFTGNVLVDTAVLSNLGRIDSVPRLGDAGSCVNCGSPLPAACPSAHRLAPPLSKADCWSRCATAVRCSTPPPPTSSSPRSRRHSSARMAHDNPHPTLRPSRRNPDASHTTP